MMRLEGMGMQWRVGTRMEQEPARSAAGVHVLLISIPLLVMTLFGNYFYAQAIDEQATSTQPDALPGPDQH
jgi:hypothetical protein